MNWRSVAVDGLPDVAKRVLIVRRVPDGNRYIDIKAYFSEPESGLPPLCDMTGVTHWADLPEVPEDET